MNKHLKALLIVASIAAGFILLALLTNNYEYILVWAFFGLVFVFAFRKGFQSKQTELKKKKQIDQS